MEMINIEDYKDSTLAKEEISKTEGI